MSDPLDQISQQVKKKRNFDTPPLHLWHPPLSGDIDILITRDGTWYHDGDKIQRETIVQLFASILRREEDGDYYLVTPAEKWRIKVELHPLVVVDVEQTCSDDEPVIRAQLNTGKYYTVDAEHPLFAEPAAQGVAALRLPHNLAAIFNRAAWYRLAEMIQEKDGQLLVTSAGRDYILG